MKVMIQACYTISSSANVELPPGRTWNDVTDWSVKYGSVFTQFGDDPYVDLGQIGDVEIDTIDFKHPDHVYVYSVGEDAEPDYGKPPIAEQE